MDKDDTHTEDPGYFTGHQDGVTAGINHARAKATTVTTEEIARTLATATALSGGDAQAIIETAERLAGLTIEWRVRYPDGSTLPASEALARNPWPLVDGAVIERREVTAWTNDSRPDDSRG